MKEGRRYVAVDSRDRVNFGLGYGDYRGGPGWGYYGGCVSLLLTIVLVLLLLKSKSYNSKSYDAAHRIRELVLWPILFSRLST